MLVIGGLDDQIGLLIWSTISNFPFSITIKSIASFLVYQDIFRGLINPLLSNQPAVWLPVSFLLSVFGNNFYNVLIVFTLLLNFYVATILFGKFKYKFFCAIVFTFSSYTWLHLGKHIEISQVWVLLLFFHVLLKSNLTKVNVKSFIKLGFLLSLAGLVFNYYGLFLALFYLFYILYDFLLDYIKTKKPNFFLLINLLGSFLISSAIVLLFLFPYINANYLNVSTNKQGNFSMTRPIEDFFSFSSRPWYFIIPSPKNVIYGQLSENLLLKIKATGNFLADDYFVYEHSANFYGYSFILLLMFCCCYVFLHKKISKIPMVNYLNTKKFVILAFVLFLFTLPPFVTISGLTIYTPGYLIYKFFPMFRVTTRLSPLILICLLLALANSSELMSKDNRVYKIFRLFLPLIAVLIILETYVPVKIYTVRDTPEIYYYLVKSTNQTTVFASYPLELARESFLFTATHQRNFINPSVYETPNFSSKKFTTALATKEGLKNAKTSGVGYLLFSKKFTAQSMLEDPKSVKSPDPEKFFRENLTLEKDFGDILLFKLDNRN